MSADSFDDDKTRIHQVIAKGVRVGNYMVEGRIGAGGMGEIFLAQDMSLHRKAVLKFLPEQLASDEQFRERMIREARSAAALNHPNIVTIYEIGEFQTRPFIAMEYLTGKPLSEYCGKVQTQEALSLAAQICDGLRVAHDAGVIHRDIKPSNILVDDDGRAKILDFGLAAVGDDSNLTRTGTTLGTASYMAPEQARGEQVDRRSDIFAVGVVLYELISGVSPFNRGNLASTIHAVVYDRVDPIASRSSDCPIELQRIVEKALEKEPEARYQSMQDMLSDLRKLYTSSDISQVITSSIIAVRDRVRSLAVLCLRNLGPAEDDYLSYGITEDLIVDLTRIGSMRISPMRSVLKYKETDDDLEVIASKLNVEMILDGSLHKSGSTIRVSAQLIDVRNDENLWAERWEESVENLPQVKEALARGISGALQVDSMVARAAQIGRPDAHDATAYEFYLRGKYAFGSREAASDLDVALELYQKALDAEPNLLAAKAGIAEIHMQRGDFDLANSQLISALSEARSSEQRADEAMLLGLLTNSHIAQSRWDDAWEFAEEAIKISKELGNLAGEAEGIGAQINILQRKAKFDQALELFERALDINRHLDDQEKAAEALKNMGTVYLRKGEFDEARALYQEAMEAARKRKDLSLEADCIGNTGLTYLHVGDLSRALPFFERALKTHEQMGEKHKCALWKNNIAMVYEARGEYRKAMESFSEVAQIRKSLGDDVRCSMSRANAAEMLAIVGEYDDAIKELNRSLETAEQHDFAMVVIQALEALGFCYFGKGEMDRAEQFYMRAIESAEEAGLRMHFALSNLSIGEFYYFTDDFERCKKHVKRTLAVAKEIGQKEAELKSSCYDAALTIRSGLFNSGIRRLRDLVRDCETHGGPRNVIAAKRLLAECLIRFSTEESEKTEGFSLLDSSLDLACDRQIAYEIKWLERLKNELSQTI
jgi:serine/threonine protein kinase/Tfp pilus assembly protein PilF